MFHKQCTHTAAQYYANEVCKCCASLAGLLASFLIDVVRTCRLVSCFIVVVRAVLMAQFIRIRRTQ